MARKQRPAEPRRVTPDAVDPRHAWDRPLQGFGPGGGRERVRAIVPRNALENRPTGERLLGKIKRARKQRPAEPRRVTPDAVDPRHAWDRPLQAPGHMQVDFEERVDFRRLHAYRLGRVRQALAGSGLGALLVFDQHNIRYISSTVIGQWAPDQPPRRCPPTRHR